VLLGPGLLVNAGYDRTQPCRARHFLDSLEDRGTKAVVDLFEVAAGRAYSHVVGDEERRSIPPVRVRQEKIGLFVADDLLGLGIEAQRPAQTV